MNNTDLLFALRQALTSREMGDVARFLDLLRQDLDFRQNQVEVEVLSVEGLTPSLPRYATPGAAGVDLQSVVDVTIAPGEQQAISTGLRLRIPKGFEGQIRPRSGMARKAQVAVTNSPGTIDSDFRGEVLVLLENRGYVPYSVAKGDRIAQLVITRVADATFVAVPAFYADSTERGDGGFGSTGR